MAARELVVMFDPSFVATSFVSSIFASEDTLANFVEALDQKQKAALYELIHASGTRYSGRALSDWRRGLSR